MSIGTFCVGNVWTTSSFLLYEEDVLPVFFLKELLAEANYWLERQEILDPDQLAAILFISSICFTIMIIT